VLFHLDPYVCFRSQVLFHTDPSGTYTRFGAKAIGAGLTRGMREYLFNTRIGIHLFSFTGALSTPIHTFVFVHGCPFTPIHTFVFVHRCSFTPILRAPIPGLERKKIKRIFFLCRTPQISVRFFFVHRCSFTPILRAPTPGLERRRLVPGPRARRRRCRSSSTRSSR